MSKGFSDHLAEIHKLFARFPNTKLDNPEATLAVYLEDLAVLEPPELKAAADKARQTSGQFLPTSAQILEAHLDLQAALPPDAEHNPRVTSTERVARRRLRAENTLDQRRIGQKARVTATSHQLKA